MGYLRLESGDIEATKKITISLWFRIPAATLTAVHAAWQELYDLWYNDETGTVKYPPGDAGIIPLVTFGPRNVEMHEWPYWLYPDTSPPWIHPTEIGHSYGYGTYHWNCATCTWTRPDDTFGGSPLIDVRMDNPTFVGDYTDKSFIGINCRGPSPVFDFRLQFGWDDGPPTIAGILQQTGEEFDPAILPSYFWFSESSVCPTAPFCGPSNLGTVVIGGTTYYWEGHQFDYLVTQTFGERPYLNWAQQPEFFGGFPDGSDDGGVTLSGDHWHHVLFSIDMDHEVNTQGTQRLGGLFGGGSFAGQVNSAARCWIALDDANKTGLQLSQFTHATPFGAGDQTLGDGLNDLVTNQAWETFQSFTDTNYTTSNTTPTSGGGVRNDTYTGRTRPSYSFTAPNFSLSPIGIPGDSDTVKLIELADLQVFTGVAVDTSNVVIRRGFVTNEGKPATTAEAIEIMGTTPVISITGKSQNWIDGQNAGTGGALDAVGTITAYSKAPSLG